MNRLPFLPAPGDSTGPTPPIAQGSQGSYPEAGNSRPTEPSSTRSEVHEPSGPSWTDAFLLASTSKLVYRDEALITHTLTNATWGFQRVDFLSEAETQLVVASDPKRTIVAFRGSQSLGDWLGNMDCLGQAQSAFGAVHPGFHAAFAVIEERLLASIRDHDPENRKELWLTGHSLGGALAHLAAAAMAGSRQITGIYTFGQPRTGYPEFKAKFEEVYGDRAFRFVNGDDLVPRVPPGEYVHAGRLIWFNEAGLPSPEAPEEYRGAAVRPALPSPMTPAEFAALRTRLQRVRGEGVRGIRTNAGEEQIDEFRGQIPGMINHKIDRYITIVHRLGSGSPALEVRGVEEAEAVSVATPPAVVPVPITEPSRAEVENAPGFPLGGEELNSFLKEQKLLSLAVHVVWSPKSETDCVCSTVAGAIFEFLNQPVVRKFNPKTGKIILNPDLESGAGIPVFLGHHFERVRESVAERMKSPGAWGPATIVFVLLDQRAQEERTQGTGFGKLLDFLFEPGRVASYWPNVQVVPVWIDPATGQSVPGELPAITEAASEPDPKVKADKIAWEAGLRTAHFLMDRKQETPRPTAGNAIGRVKLFVSYSRTDIDRSGPLAANFQKVVNTELGTIFTSEDVPSFRERKAQVSLTSNDAVVLIVRTDSYSTTPATVREILDAKKSGLPIITLNVLREGRGRSFSCEGNSITLAWSPTTPRGETPEKEEFRDLTWRCLKICLRAWLHHLHFHQMTGSVFALRQVEWRKDLVTVISRPPELLDFVQGPLAEVGSGIVLYPDPPLSTSETAILRRAQPKVRLVTPTTLSKEVWRRVPWPPLSGMRVALSLSISPDLARQFTDISPQYEGSRSNGILLNHMDGAIAYLTLSLVRGGATLGFGGRLQSTSYAGFLADLISTHKQTAQSQRDLLFSYLNPFSEPGEDEEVEATLISDIRGPEPTSPCSLETRRALHFSAMRYRMGQECAARAIMGGRTTPELRKNDGGYIGRFPGQAEEAWQSLAAGKPIYVAGGFLGVSGLVARALCGHLDGLPKEQQWLGSAHHANLCREYDAARLAAWDLPATLDGLWHAFAEKGKGYFWGPGSEDSTKLWSNGLTVKENLNLFSSVQPDQISALVTKGLAEVAASRRREEKSPGLKIALFNGSFTDVPDAEGYAALVLGSARLRGADAALDERLQGLIQRTLDGRRNRPIQTIRIATDQLPGDYVLLYWIESLKGAHGSKSGEWLKAQIVLALDAFIETAAEHRLSSLSVVPMGVNLGLTPEDSVELIVSTFLNKPNLRFPLQSIALCELDPARYDRVLAKVKELTSKSEGRLDYAELEPHIPKNFRIPLFLNFVEHSPESRKALPSINQSARGTGGGGAVPVVDQPIDWTKLSALADSPSGMPPAFPDHEAKGQELSQLVLNDAVRDCVRENRTLAWEVLHDIPCSAIPYELLAFKTADDKIYHPALEVGMCRRLASQDVSPPSSYSAKTRYRLLIVADPTDNLPGTRKEAESIISALTEAFGAENSVPGFEIKAMIGSRQASLNSVLAEIGTGQYDFIHYAGHGNHDTHNPKKSGLLFKQGYLTAFELRETVAQRRKVRKAAQAAGRSDAAASSHPPALVLLNACLAVNLIVKVKNQAFNQASLAQAVLEAGVCGFIGNRWLVGDQSAALFAVSVYSLMAKGTPLGEAVRLSRCELHKLGLADWANYELYGSREIRL